MLRHRDIPRASETRFLIRAGARTMSVDPEAEST
jgi:hypothetical protein